MPPSVLVQRDTRQENKEIKEGKIPQQWAENPHVLRQKDRDVRWVKKNKMVSAILAIKII
jgi:IS5 family transposase